MKSEDNKELSGTKQIVQRFKSIESKYQNPKFDLKNYTSLPSFLYDYEKLNI